MDTCNPDGFTSSMADDIFFVLQKCTRCGIFSEKFFIADSPLCALVFFFISYLDEHSPVVMWMEHVQCSTMPGRCGYCSEDCDY